MGNNQSATTSPIPEFHPNYPQGGQVQGPRQAQNYRAYPPPQAYSQYPPPQADPYGQGYPAPGPRRQPGPGPRRPPPSRDPYQGGPYGPSGSANPGVPAAVGKPDIFSRQKRPTVNDIMDYADEDWAHEEEADFFRCKPKPKQMPLSHDFDPFQRYKERGGDVSKIIPQDDPYYRSRPPRDAPAPKTYHYQPDPNAPIDIHHVHQLEYDPHSGELTLPGGNSLPLASSDYMPPPGFFGPSGNPNGGLVFPPGQGYERPY